MNTTQPTGIVQTGMEEQPKTPRNTSGSTTNGGPVGEDGMLILSYVLSGILLYGGLGWLGSKYLHQSWLLPVGLVAGLVASIYLVIKRYGSQS